MTTNHSSDPVAPGALAPWLAISALIEFLILRTGTRIAIHVPAGEALRAPYLVLAALGRFAFFVALVLVIALLAMAFVALIRRTQAPARVAGALLLLFLVAAAALAIEPAAGPVTAVATALAAAGLCVAIATHAGLKPGIPFLLLAVSLAAAAGYAVVQSEAALPQSAGEPLLQLAELSGVLFALAAPLLLSRRPAPPSLAFGVLAGLITVGALAAPAASGRIILLWNTGLATNYPVVLYGAAAAALAATLAEALRRRDVSLASALLLIVTGGVGLHSTYQTALVLAACVTVLLRERPPRPPHHRAMMQIQLDNRGLEPPQPMVRIRARATASEDENCQRMRGGTAIAAEGRLSGLGAG
jgi:hypothetical protein